MSHAYYIWNHKIRAWQRPKSKGFTKHVFDAGIYTKAEAEEICEYYQLPDSNPESEMIAINDEERIKQLIHTQHSERKPILKYGIN